MVNSIGGELLGRKEMDDFQEVDKYELNSMKSVGKPSLGFLSVHQSFALVM